MTVVDIRSRIYKTPYTNLTHILHLIQVADVITEWEQDSGYIL